MRKGALTTSTALALAVVVIGCGGGGDGSAATGASAETGATTESRASTETGVSLPAPKAIAACFERAGVVSVYRKKERGVPFVNGLVEGTYAVSAELTGSQAATDELLERYEAEKNSKLVAFEVLGGAAVGVINEEAPTSKRIVIKCFGSTSPSG